MCKETWKALLQRVCIRKHGKTWAPVYARRRKYDISQTLSRKPVNLFIRSKNLQNCPFIDKNPNRKEGKNWFTDEIITTQEEFKRVITDVAVVRPQGKNIIGSKSGNLEFVAMREVSSRVNNLNVAGIVMASCGHGSILAACDMYEGKTSSIP